MPRKVESPETYQQRIRRQLDSEGQPVVEPPKEQPASKPKRRRKKSEDAEQKADGGETLERFG